MGMSSLPRRKDGSKWIVMGSNGPSKVVGMCFPETNSFVRMKIKVRNVAWIIEFL